MADRISGIGTEVNIAYSLIDSYFVTASDAKLLQLVEWGRGAHSVVKHCRISDGAYKSR